MPRLLFRRKGRGDEAMISPNYVSILKLDKIAMKSKTHMDFLKAVEERRQYARNLGIEASFIYFVEQAWLQFGDGK
jgi:hypothetical protein